MTSASGPHLRLQLPLPAGLFRRPCPGGVQAGSVPWDCDAPATTGALLVLCLFAVAMAQLLAGVIFFYAANWWTMGAPLKLGALMAALAGCGVGWAVAPAGIVRSSLACTGAVLGGVLFAVHGQIWQTGANTWELFAVWTLVAAIWGLLTLEDSAWAVCAVVGVIAIVLHLVEVVPSWLFFRDEDLTVVKSLLLCGGFVSLLVAGRFLVGLSRPDRWFGPVFAAVACALFVAAGCYALVEMEGPRLGLGIPGRIFLVAVLVLVLLRWRDWKPWLQAYAFGVALVMGAGLFLRAASEVSLQFSLLNIDRLESYVFWIAVSLCILVLVALFLRVARHLFFSEEHASRAGVLLHGALWLGAGLGAWLGVTVLATGVAGLWYKVLGLFGVTPLCWTFLAAGLTFVLAGALFRRSGLFATQARASLSFWSLVAFSLFVGVFSFDYFAMGWRDLGFCIRNGALTAVVAVSLYLSLNRAHWTDIPAGLLGVIAAGAALLAQMDMLGLSVTVQAWVLLAAALPLLGFGLFCLWRYTPGVRVLGVVLLACSFLVPAVTEFLFGNADLSPFVPRAFAFLMGAIPMAVAFLVAPWKFRPGTILAGLVLLCGSLFLPAGGAALVGMGALALVTIGWPLLVTGFALAAWSVIRFYYSLQTPLDEKALYMVAGGLVFLGVWLAFARRDLRGPLWRPAALAAGLVCALVPVGLELRDGQAKERIVSQGREVYLPLRPVDPRSLLQGDYMALYYGIDGLRTREAPEARGCLVLDTDAVARSLQPVGEGGACDHEAGAVPVRVRPGTSEARLAPDSFFFEEGTHRTWERARYAIVRVLDGEVVMTGLADERRQRLEPDRTALQGGAAPDGSVLPGAPQDRATPEN